MRFLAVIPFLIAAPASAQQAAAPVEPFAYGKRIGTPSNPLYAIASAIIPSAQAEDMQAASPVELFSYGRRVGTPSNPLSIVCASCGGGMTQAQADARYLQAAGGGTALTGQMPIAGGTFNFTDSTGDALTASATLGRNSYNLLNLEGNNHSPALSLSFLGNANIVASLNPDTTGYQSGFIVHIPSYTEADSGIALPAGAPLIVQDASSAPASNAACTAGMTEFVGAYEYRCISSGKWGRIELQTGY